MRTPTKVWNKNFTLLWQGQLVSAIGDVVYRIALGFWVLEKTGSTALMGTLMAASAIPQIVIGPFAGVVVDRTSRKWMIVLMDMARGLVVLAVAIAAISRHLSIWMVFVAAILIGIGSAFFGPAVMSSIPDIVPKDQLLKANSSSSLIHSLSGILGNAGGGSLFALLGAPVLFLINGLSYVFSGVSELFISIPKVERMNKETNFFADMREGLKFAWSTPALRVLFVNAGILNFFLTLAGVLFLPYFQQSSLFTATDYGIAMSVLTAGSLVALAIISIIDIPAHRRFTVFIVCAIIFCICRGALFSFENLVLILVFFALVGFSVAILNSFIGTMTQLVVPQEYRGKVFSLLGTFSQGLTPIGLAVGGVLAEFMPIRTIVPLTAVIVFFGFIPVFASKDLKRVFAIESNEEKGSDHE